MELSQDKKELFKWANGPAMEEIKTKIESFSIGEIFSVDKCFSHKLWDELPTGVKSALGQNLAEQVRCNECFSNVIFAGKGISGSMRDVQQYKKIKD